MASARELPSCGTILLSCRRIRPACLGLDWLRQAARELQPKDHWEKVAITPIVEDLYGQQRAFAGRVFDGANGAAGDEAIDMWVDQHLVAVDFTQEQTEIGGIHCGLPCHHHD